MEKFSPLLHLSRVLRKLSLGIFVLLEGLHGVYKLHTSPPNLHELFLKNQFTTIPPVL